MDSQNVNRANYPKSELWFSFKFPMTEQNNYQDDQTLKEDLSGANALHKREADASDPGNKISRQKFVSGYSFSPIVRENGVVSCFMKRG